MAIGVFQMHNVQTKSLKQIWPKNLIFHANLVTGRQE
jgi:hypothetical protein